MEIKVDSLDIQEYHEFSRDFRRGSFDGHQLARFLNDNLDNHESKWVVQGGSRDGENDDSGKKSRPEKVVLENVQLIDGSWLYTDKMIVDNDSVLWIAKSSKRTITDDEDKQPRAWPELEQCYNWLTEFYDLDESFFDQSNRYRDVYLTRTDGVQIACHMHELLHPELWRALKSSTEAAYDERGLSVTMHPFRIKTKVNFSPKPEAMKSLSQIQLKAAIGRDDLEIAVVEYEDYDERVISFGSQMPYHAHVKALRAVVEVAQNLGNKSD